MVAKGNLKNGKKQKVAICKTKHENKTRKDKIISTYIYIYIYIYICQGYFSNSEETQAPIFMKVFFQLSSSRKFFFQLSRKKTSSYAQKLLTMHYKLRKS